VGVFDWRGEEERGRGGVVDVGAKNGLHQCEEG